MTVCTIFSIFSDSGIFMYLNWGLSSSSILLSVLLLLSWLPVYRGLLTKSCRNFLPNDDDDDDNDDFVVVVVVVVVANNDDDDDDDDDEYLQLAYAV